MKRHEHIRMARAIGKDSWELINFMQLPKNASGEEQIEALKADATWMDGHMIEIAQEIDVLCRLIEEAADEG